MFHFVCFGTQISAEHQTLHNAAVHIPSAYIFYILQEQVSRGETPVINIGVTYDGTWQKRGVSSLYRVGVCMDIITGLVIDYELMSKYCQLCKK